MRSGIASPKPVSGRPTCDSFGRSKDGGSIEAVVAVKLGDRARLAEVLDPERTCAMPIDAAEPRERLRMRIRDRDEGRIARQFGEKGLDVGAVIRDPAGDRARCLGAGCEGS